MSEDVKTPQQNTNPGTFDLNHAGGPITKEEANKLLKHYLEIKGDFKKIVPALDEKIKRLLGSDWNGFAFDKNEVLRVMGMPASPAYNGHYLLVLMGADLENSVPPDMPHYPTVILIGATSEDEKSFVAYNNIDPTEHPPKLYQSEIKEIVGLTLTAN